jgi:hypothetical protein
MIGLLFSGEISGAVEVELQAEVNIATKSNVTKANTFISCPR